MSSEKKRSLPEMDADAAARSTGAELAREKKVRIKIPEDHKNPANRVVPVCINGYLYYINRGQTVEVPESVAAILSQAQYI